MKKILYTILIGLLAVNTSFSQNSQGKDTVTNYTDINGNKQGKWIKYYDANKEYVRYIGFFIDNKPQGTFKHYHPNGRVKAVQNYNENGSSDVKFYWDNGAMAANGKFNTHQKRIGDWIFFYPSGEKQRKVYFKEGKRQGEEVTYFQNGSILTSYTYLDDVKNGAYSFYFNNGNIREKGQYVNGVKQGEFTTYLPDKSLDEKGNYIDGKKEGKWLVAKQDNSFDTIEYKNGERTDRDSLENAFWKRAEWAKEHPEQFKRPEDYYDNPFEYFKP